LDVFFGTTGRQWAVDMRFGTWNVGPIVVWVTEDGFERDGEV
jgi:hypothetical protein